MSNGLGLLLFKYKKIVLKEQFRLIIYLRDLSNWKVLRTKKQLTLQCKHTKKRTFPKISDTKKLGINGFAL
jgi:hypothetical protein